MDLEVRDARGKKAAGALVRFLAAPAPVGITGPEGRLTLSLPDEEVYLLVETEEGQLASTSLRPGSAAEPWTVTLTAPVAAEGRVVDAESKAPVPGALVWSEGMLRTRPVRAAADGSFRLQVPGRPSLLRVAAPGYLAERIVPPPPSEEGGASGPVALRLTRAGFLTGRVVDADGLEPGPVELSVQAEGYRKATWRGEVPEKGEARPAEVRLEVGLTADQEVVLEIAMSTVQGQVLSPAGAPAANTLVSLSGTHGEWSVHSFFHSDGQGRFEARLPPGDYRLTVSSESGEARLQVPAGGAANVQVQLQP